MDVLKLDSYDAHADLVTVEDFLQKLRGFRLDLELAVRQRGVDEAVADDFAHGGFRGVFDHGGLIRHIEQIFHRILDLVLDAELTMFSSPVSIPDSSGRERFAPCWKVRPCPTERKPTSTRWTCVTLGL